MKKLILIATVIALFVFPTSSPACTNSSAKTLYLQTWHDVRPYFKAPATPPKLVRDHKAQPGYLAFVGSGSTGFREVHIGDGLWGIIAGKEGCQKRLSGRATLIHEFAHVYQNDAVFNGETSAVKHLRKKPWWGPICEDCYYEGITEGTAETFAHALMQKLYGLPWAAYRDTWQAEVYVKEMREILPPGFLMHGQFKENLGKEARSVPYPTEPAIQRQ